MSVEVLHPGEFALPQPVRHLTSWEKICDVTETVTYVVILGAGFLTPLFFGLYAVIFR